MDARTHVLRLMAQGDHSEAELRRRLEQRGFSALEIEDAIGWGRDNAAVNDARVSTRTVDKQIDKGRGPLRIEAELERRGLPVPALGTSAETRARAEALLAKNAARFAGEPNKAAAWLARQGYDEDVVVAVVEKLIGPLSAGQ